MFLLSPEKLLVVLVVAMVVVGPDKLPKLAGQIGVLWRDLRRWRTRLEGEARNVFPDLPPFDSISQAVRSPLSYLDRLAVEGPSQGSGTEEPLPATPPNEVVVPRPPQPAAVDRPGRVDQLAPSMVDPSMN